tara:strand:- start:722 stop:1063 length:342 start_codon:yes stop_codon:yes gene_type:complete
MTRSLLFVFFGVMLISMLAVCIYAGNQQNMFNYFREHGSDPWFVATLLDCYWGFFIFYCWLVYQEKSWLSRIPWLLAICSLGMIAVSSYGLMRTYRLKKDACFEDFLLRESSS